MFPTLPDDAPWDALARFFAGELPADEVGALETWMSAEPGRREAVDRLREVWVEAGVLRQRWDVEAALVRMTQTPEGARVIQFPPKYRLTSMAHARWGRLAVAGVAALALVAGGLTLWKVGSRGRTKPPELAATTEVTTPRGQRVSLRLPDGTQVMLGPSSVIRYAPAYGHGGRTVELEGQAYFVVTHDPTRPFAVHTAHGLVTDIGTRFAVHAYATDSIVDVVVAEGEVSLSARQDTLRQRPAPDSVLLAPGDLGRVTSAGTLSIARDVSVERYLAWTEGRLVFRDTPMRDVVVELGRWYDIDVRLADPALAAKRLSASFKNEPASEVLRLIAASLDVRRGSPGDVVTIQPK